MNKNSQSLLGAIILLTLAVTFNYWYEGLNFDPPLFVVDFIAVVASQLFDTQLAAAIVFDVSIFVAGTALFASQNYEKHAKELSVFSQ